MYEIRIKNIRIDRNIQILRNDPFPKGVAKLRGGGNRYRIREGKYRMLYEIDPLVFG